MQAYIGTKIILAEPMDELSFKVRFKGEERKADSIENGIAGYHIQYSNPDGSKYDSWSPADVFERSYRRISTDEKILISTY